MSLQIGRDSKNSDVWLCLGDHCVMVKTVSPSVSRAKTLVFWGCFEICMGSTGCAVTTYQVSVVSCCKVQGDSIFKCQSGFKEGARQQPGRH